MLVYHSKSEDVLKLVHPCRCKRCEHPCTFGSGAFIEGEIEKLTTFLDINQKEVNEKYLEKLTKFNTTLFRPKIIRKDDNPYGKCIFFDDINGCKIHAVKPFECKVAMGCKDYGEELITWFDLNYFFDPDDLGSLREYKIYIESGGSVLKGAEFENFTNEKINKKMNKFEDLKKSRKKDWDKILGLKD